MPSPITEDLVDIDAHLAFTLAHDEDLFGKCTEELKIRIPSALKDALMAAAAAKRMPVSAYLRLCIAYTVLGPERVASVLAKRMLLDPRVVVTTASSDEG